jgi:3-hydroxybutyryl-CoA dehydrogenase
VELSDIKRIGVVGSGLMGHGIALSFAVCGYPVVMSDLNDEILSKAVAAIKSDLETFAEEGIISQNEIGDVLSRITTTSDIAELARDADYVVEAASEKIDIKIDIFRKLDEFCPSSAILTSNTSSLTLSSFTADVRRKDKLAITHYFNPPHIVPCVEVVKGAETSDETIDITYALLEKVKKLPVKLNKELPGYLVNRIQMGMLREVWALKEQGVASARDIDRAVKGSFGFRLASCGPLTTFDFIDPALLYEVASNLFPVIDDRHDAPQWVKETSKPEDGVPGGALGYTREELNRLAKKRDKEFLHRLKVLYWS